VEEVEVHWTLSGTLPRVQRIEGDVGYYIHDAVLQEAVEAAAAVAY
jgi:hypothetical protein